MLYVILSLALILGVGFSFSLWGNKIFYPLMALSGASAGFVLGTYLTENIWLGLLIGVGVGVIYSLIVKFLHKAALGLTGGAIGFLLSTQLLTFIPVIAEPFTYIISGIIALVLCLLFIKKSDFIISLTTAVYGATITAPAIVFLVKNIGGLGAFGVENDFLATFSSVSTYIDSSVVGNNMLLVLGMVLAITVLGLVAQGRKK